MFVDVLTVSVISMFVGICFVAIFIFSSVTTLTFLRCVPESSDPDEIESVSFA